MEHAIPAEIPSTGNCQVKDDTIESQRALVRDNLKQLRRGETDETHAVRALQDYLGLIIENPLQDPVFSWRLPWTSTRTKKTLEGYDLERRMVVVTIGILLSRMAASAASAKDYKRASQYLNQGEAYVLWEMQNSSDDRAPVDLTARTLRFMACSLSGLAHMLFVQKFLDLDAPISKASAAVHSRIAMYAQEQFSSAIQLAPTKDAQNWLSNMRKFNLAACRLFLAIEQAHAGNIGVALGHLQQINTGDSWKKIPQAKRLVELVEKNKKQYEHDNKMVAFQPVRTDKDLDKLPAGRCAIQVQPWAPNSKEHARGDYF